MALLFFLLGIKFLANLRAFHAAFKEKPHNLEPHISYTPNQIDCPKLMKSLTLCHTLPSHILKNLRMVIPILYHHLTTLHTTQHFPFVITWLNTLNGDSYLKKTLNNQGDVLKITYRDSHMP